MRAERNRRAAILTAEGTRQSAILTAEGSKQAQILEAEGQAQATVAIAEARARAIELVVAAIRASNPDQSVLAYQYLQMLPELAKGDANKVWVIPSEIGEALKGLGKIQPS